MIITFNPSNLHVMVKLILSCLNFRANDFYHLSIDTTLCHEITFSKN